MAEQSNQRKGLYLHAVMANYHSLGECLHGWIIDEYADPENKVENYGYIFNIAFIVKIIIITITIILTLTIDINFFFLLFSLGYCIK